MNDSHRMAMALCEKYACGNCEWLGGDDALNDITDLSERVAPGEPMPAGECPECGALAYYLRREER